MYSVYINCVMVDLNYKHLEFSMESLNVTIVFDGVPLLYCARIASFVEDVSLWQKFRWLLSRLIMQR